MSAAQYNPEIHHRRSIRLKGHDYAGDGLYFVTICAHREFIEFAEGNPFGATCVPPVRAIIAEEWLRCGEIRDDVFPREFVVMPDHFHGLMRIQKGPSELGHVIGAFEAAASRRIRRGDTHVAPPRDIRIWHRNYYEAIVRTSEAAAKIAEYIRLNPWRCVMDLGNGLRGIGNPSLLNRQKVGMLCSRRCPDTVLATPRKRASGAGAEHCIISGFHSPPEREILAGLLQSKAGLICCPAWGIDAMKIPAEWLPALEQNRMLILEMRNRDGNLAAAEQRNRFVIEKADDLWIPHVTRGGMLARSLRENGELRMVNRESRPGIAPAFARLRRGRRNDTGMIYAEEQE